MNQKLEKESGHNAYEEERASLASGFYGPFALIKAVEFRAFSR